MYAVIKTGGKQHKVKAGDVIEVELIHSDGDTITFHPLLVVDDEGTTHFGKEAAKAVVTAKLVGEQKGDKVKIFKYRPKTGYSKRAGHRQMYTLLEIQDVTLGESTKRAAKTPAEPKSKKKAEAIEDRAPEPVEVEAAAEAPEAEAPAVAAEAPEAQVAQDDTDADAAAADDTPAEA